MGVNLSKGQRVSLDKNMTMALVGLGWDPNQYDGGFDFDLDASAFLLGKNGKVLKDEDFVFYGNQNARNGAVMSMGDDTSGGNSEDGDDEQIFIDFTKVPPEIEKIAITVTIYDSDAIEGLNLPNNMKAEAARKMEQGLLQGVQLPISSIGTVTSEVTSAIPATTQVTRQILNQSLSQVKVHLKANYNMYIKEETNEDRKKREEEEAEIERLYREMQMQQNEPKKKNPLTQLIEAL